MRMMPSFLLVAAVVLSACPAAPAADPPITVVYRFDDYNGTVIDNADAGILDVFRRHGLRCTFAVIPNARYVPVSPEKLDFLKVAADSGVVDIAQHGYTHNVLAITHGWSGRYGSEFKGIYYQEQEERIRRGKEFLDRGLGRPVTVFVPPYNSYDSDTVRALETLGFTCLSASLGTDVPPSTRLKLAPATVGPESVREAVALARKTAGDSPAMVVVMGHDYEFKEGLPTELSDVALKTERCSMASLSADLDWLQAQKGVRVLSFGQLCAEPENLGAARFIANRALWEQADRVPPFLKKQYPNTVYFTAERAAELRKTWAVYLWLFYGVAAGAAWGVAFIFAVAAFRRIGRLKWVLIMGAMALLLVALAWGAPNGFHSWRAVLAATVLAGGSSGLWLGLLKSRRSA